MDDSDLDLEEYVAQFVRILSKNSPARDVDSKPHEIKRHGVVVSPYPGNLKNNGNVKRKGVDGCYEVLHGYRPAPYAMYANKRSRKPNYIQKSVAEFKSYLTAKGWEEGEGEL